MIFIIFIKILIYGLSNLFKAILLNNEGFSYEEVAMILEKIVIILKASY